MNQALLDRIRPVTRKLQRIRFWRFFAVLVLLTAVVGWLLFDAVQRGQLPGQTVAIALLIWSVVAAVVTAITSRLSYRNPRRVAQRIEQQFPELDQKLLTALSQKGDQLGFLQQRVVKEARDHSRDHRWTDAVPSGQLMLGRVSGIVAAAALGVVLSWLTGIEPSLDPVAASRIKREFNVRVQPGDAEVERGTSLVVTARFTGYVPDEAELLRMDADGGERRLTMSQNLSDPVVGAMVSSIDQPFEYRVVMPGWESRPYRIDVFEYPTLQRSDAFIQYPEYTGIDDKRIEDTVRVSAVEGSEVTWICYLNKPVASAELVGKDETRLPLSLDPANGGGYSINLPVQDTQRWELHLTDDAGRKNKYPPELVVRALPNQSPQLKLTVAGDVTVSPLEELPLEAEASDDYGIDRVGLSYTFAASPSQDIVLSEDIPRGGKATVSHLVEFEKLDAEPDQLLSYHFWAEDYGPDGELRRTASDMYFAEVRPFEEIYRAGEAPPGGQQSQQQSQNGQQAEQLAELQKEIINATWRVIRDVGKTTSKETADNVRVIRESQADALQQLEQLAGQLQDPQSKAHVATTRQSMTKVISELAAAEVEPATELLREALAAEQAAYAGLLRLRAREFQVTQSQRNQQSRSGSASQRRRQQQLDELQLDQEENRYETQQQAQQASEQEQQAREVRQVLNRLRDLARRQEDLNEELARLQSALEQADTKEEEEEIERQLKRLRQQQQDMLREIDELNERMQSPENQQEMAEASQQLEQTRENVRQAGEALQQNDASQALTSGRRAERELEEMRDEFRQKTAGQFNDAMREMRNEAQQLDQRQQDLSKELQDLNNPETSPGLRPEEDPQQLEQQLQTQGEQLEKLLQRMQQTVEEAEVAEPLLAQQLYDSYRETRQRKVDQRLAEATELLKRGFQPEASQVEQQAKQGIEKLREDLEEAADSVLGDPTKALQRALGELEQLERELESELNRNRPGRQPESASQSSRNPQGETESNDSSRGGQPSESPSQQPSQTGSPSRSSSSASQAESPQRSSRRSDRAGQPQRQAGGANPYASESENLLEQMAAESPAEAPLTGDGFRQWSDRLREVEEIVDDPELRSQAARIRDRARDVRRDLLRHSKQPQWELVDKLIATPLSELKQQVSAELMRRSAEKFAPVPLQKDPVPAEFSGAVQRYYENLGSGR